MSNASIEMSQIEWQSVLDALIFTEEQSCLVSEAHYRAKEKIQELFGRKKIKDVGSPKRIEIVGKPKQRVSGAWLAEQLGAEPIATVSKNADIIDLAEIGSRLIRESAKRTTNA